MTTKNTNQFASGTVVSPEKTMMEIRALLGKHGATKLQTIEDTHLVQIAFALKNRVIRFEIEIPLENDRQFNPSYRQRTTRRALWEAEVRRRWRVCLLILKSKLEAVATNAKLFDVELLPYFVMPDGRTVAQHINSERLDQLYAGTTQALLGPAPQEGSHA
jgi:hypothetical protein